VGVLQRCCGRGGLGGLLLMLRHDVFLSYSKFNKEILWLKIHLAKQCPQSLNKKGFQKRESG
jgi:hypothetical protein